MKWPLFLLGLCLSLGGCASFTQDVDGARIRKTVSLIGIVTPTSVAIGPSYSMTAELSPECRAVVIGESRMTVADLEALCTGEDYDSE